MRDSFDDGAYHPCGRGWEGPTEVCVGNTLGGAGLVETDWWRPTKHDGSGQQERLPGSTTQSSPVIKPRRSTLPK